MDQESLVETSIEAGSRFLSEFEKYAPVACAVWLKEGDSGRWYLYVVSERIDETNIYNAYGEVLRIAAAMKEPKLDPFRVRVVTASSARAQQISRIAQQTKTTPPFGWPSDIGPEDARIYALPIGAASS